MLILETTAALLLSVIISLWMHSSISLVGAGLLGQDATGGSSMHCGTLHSRPLQRSDQSGSTGGGVFWGREAMTVWS